MKYRRLGNTGLKVSEVSFGTIPVLKGPVPVLPEYYNLNDDEALAVMKYAFDKGCNLYDTAIVPEYGDAEIKLGKFASYVGRENIIISDKARFFDGNEMHDAVNKSIDNLGAIPDIYFVHQVDYKNQDQTFSKHGALQALYELKRQGKIGFVGVASHYYDILLRGARDERVDVLQGSGNILERGMLERFKDEKHFEGKGFLVNKVYAAGILPTFFSTKTLIEGVLSYPISSALIGLGKKEQIDLAMGQDFQANLIGYSKVIATLEGSFIPIRCIRCQSCKCVNGIEIHTLFRQFNYCFLGKDTWAIRKLAMGIRKSTGFCRTCTQMTCVRTCVQNVDIPRKMEELLKLTTSHIRKSK